MAHDRLSAVLNLATASDFFRCSCCSFQMSASRANELELSVSQSFGRPAMVFQTGASSAFCINLRIFVDKLTQALTKLLFGCPSMLLRRRISIHSFCSRMFDGEKSFSSDWNE